MQTSPAPTMKAKGAPNPLKFGDGILMGNSGVRFGFVQFDPSLTGEGWASVAGEPATRINHTSDLNEGELSQAIWVTSLNAQNLAELGCEQAEAILPFDHFGVQPQELQDEFGYPPSVNAVSAAEFVAELFDKAMKLAIRGYETSGNKPMPLSARIRSMLLESNSSALSARHDDWTHQRVCNQAYLYQHLCMHPRPAYHTIVKFRWPRRNYAEILLDCPVTGPTLYPAEPNPGADVVAWVEKLTQTHSGYAAVKIKSTLSEHTGLVHQAQKKRTWLPLCELGILATVAELDISELLLSDETITPSKHAPLPMFGEQTQTIASGIVAQAHWQSLLPQNLSEAHPDDATCVGTGVAAWDRTLCLKAALSFAEEGFHVIGYGNGAVELALVDEEIPRAIHLASELEMVAPLSLLATLDQG